MIAKIKNLLENSDADGYKIIETKTDAEESFLVKKAVDLTRSKEVHHFNVTVYMDFQDNQTKYKGSSTFNVHPSMKDADIKKLIDDGIFAAGFVKNEYYEIPKAENEKIENLKSKFSTGKLSDWMPKLVDALYINDNEKKGGINSAEIFLNKNYKRILTSSGVDSSYESYDGMIEFITTWKESEETEEIELYKMLTFSDYDPKFISSAVSEMIFLAKERANAKDTVPSGKYRVILSGDSVKEVLSYYVIKSWASSVYNKISTVKVGDLIQGEEVKGDLINLVLDPKIENSVHSAPIDNDGLILSKVSVIEQGKLKSYHGDLRHSYYLGTKPTGSIGNFVVSAGSKTISDMKKATYVELVTFSDFQMNPVTGEFGGEIRLGWYFDGETTKKITGGSLSGNIEDIHHNIYLSKELQSNGDFVGPKAIEMFDLTVAGK